MEQSVDFTAVFLAGPSPMAVLSPDLAFLAVNDAYLEVSGRGREELVGQDVFTAFPDNPDDPRGARTLRASLERVLATGQRHVMPLQRYDVAVAGQPGVVEQRFWSTVNGPVLDEDGSVRWILHRVEEVTHFLERLPSNDAGAGERQAMQAEVFARSEELHQANEQLAAAAGITAAVLADAPTEDVLELIASRARSIAGVDQTLVLVPDDSREHLVVAASAGAQADAYRSLRLPLAGAAGPEPEPLSVRVFRTGRSVISEDASPAARDAGLGPEVAVGAALGVPLGPPDAVRGVLAVVNVPGHSITPTSVVRSLELFAAQAAIVLELAERRRDAVLLSVLDDRERIAGELNTAVVGRLSTIATGLTAALKIIQREAAARRVGDAVRAVDEVIQQLNSAVFAIHADPVRERALHRRIQDLLDAAAETLDVAMTSRLDSRLDTALRGPVRDRLMAVLDTALAGVSRRSGVRHVTVTVDLRPEPGLGCLFAQVEDDGTFASPDSDAVDPADLTTGLGDSLTLAARPAGGTVVTWQILHAGDTPVRSSREGRRHS
ncbi:GAF domain-containing protein [Amycolatopsis lexingtonensis]|uniref:GAF domain-containing protein n=1 Tax=Amycolatopsis lexingtonensis TaxID=218822 RepID=A0ABR9HSM1_9PSEU|nr:PAS domain-containing protein [Amycolatopsis lexingtonensis]MBE1493924.1 GAF domain-containing protein [Amycolatopsis lexingtonensis]